jgi:hypothetical protein
MKTTVLLYRPSWYVSSPGSYSEGLGFNSQPGVRLLCLNFLQVVLCGGHTLRGKLKFYDVHLLGCGAV